MIKAITALLLCFLASSVSAFVPFKPAFSKSSTTTTKTTTSNTRRLNMITITEGVEFDTIAREWRCKWSADGDKASLIAAQQALLSVADDLKQVEGVKSVERIVCGGCLDFKVITSLEADKFGAWEAQGFAPEQAFLEMLQDIDGISVIETQTYTKMPV